MYIGPNNNPNAHNPHPWMSAEHIRFEQERTALKRRQWEAEEERAREEREHQAKHANPGHARPPAAETDPDLRRLRELMVRSHREEEAKRRREAEQRARREAIPEQVAKAMERKNQRAAWVALVHRSWPLLVLAAVLAIAWLLW